MKPKNKLILPFFLNLFFTVFELLGGIWTNSIALISDAIHDLGDSLSIGLSILLHRKSLKDADEAYTYGYHRFSLLVGLISSIVLLIGSIIVIYEAIPRLINPETVATQTLIWFSIAGVAVNLFAAIKARAGKSINERVISLHLFEDAFGWIALLLGAILMNFFHIYRIDAILSILFTLYILWHVFENLDRIIRVFMEVAPKEPSVPLLKKHLESMDGVKEVHHIHLWTIDGEHALCTLHVVLEKDVTKADYVRIQQSLHEELHEHGVLHATLEFEYEDALCTSEDCQETLQKMLELSHPSAHHHHHH
ncbi:MAG: cation diffusion facilitator family transporter [Candidatus Izemoplasmatales bacterium]|nr:cation diffusion facilitator family transporter [Candidatus Izemoplasmatales bacterium]